LFQSRGWKTVVETLEARRERLKERVIRNPRIGIEELRLLQGRIAELQLLLTDSRQLIEALACQEELEDEIVA
jgi:hypothetical protein